MSVLAGRLIAIHDALHAAAIPHAFGGAIALAYCTQEPRGTRDIDINVFTDPSRAHAVLDALTPEVEITEDTIPSIENDGQVRLWWDDTPLDLFFDVHELHRHAAANVSWVPFEGRTIPVLACADLVVFKAWFNRTRDWADIEDVVAAGALDADDAIRWVTELLGPTDPITVRLTQVCR